MPVALITRRSDGVTAASSRRAAHGTRSAGVRSAALAADASPASPLGEDVRAQPLDDRAHGVGHERARVALEQLLRGRLAQHLVDGRQRAQPRLAAFLSPSASPLLPAVPSVMSPSSSPRAARGCAAPP
jgi:hypothetical protein